MPRPLIESRTPASRPVRSAIALAALAALACAGCTSSKSNAAPPTGSASPATVAAAASSTPSVAATTTRPAKVAKPKVPPPPPASVHANELGLVPVLMYHRLVAHPSSDYERTPADFVADLTYLEKNHFVPITAANFVAGKINIPAGKHPVVLTFDDGTVSQFELGADGQPKPGTAVALLEAFSKAHPDFPAIATFYVNRAPFGTAAGAPALAWLHAHGDEVGDHTVNHFDLYTKTDAVVQQEIVGNLTMIESAAPGIKVTTMALPFGSRPKDHALAEVGSSGGTSYSFSGVFAVGANPSHSPYNAAFDPFYIPRIRAEDQSQAKAADRPYISSYWLPWLVAHPAQLYVSDGNPAKISYPKATTITVAAKWKAEAQPY